MKVTQLKKSIQKGFTLIELMIAVAIVGILSAVALPAYQDYTIRSQVTEGISLASGAKSGIVEYHSNKGELPGAGDVDFDGASGKYVTSVAIGENGVITATFGGDEANSKITVENKNTIVLTPEETDEGNIKWECTGTVDAKYLPASCK